MSNALISLVYKRRALWDQKDRNHHNRYILDKLWEEVATELHSTSKLSITIYIFDKILIYRQCINNI